MKHETFQAIADFMKALISLVHELEDNEIVRPETRIEVIKTGGRLVERLKEEPIE